MLQVVQTQSERGTGNTGSAEAGDKAEIESEKCLQMCTKKIKKKTN